MVEPISDARAGRSALVAAAVRGDRDAFARLVEPELRLALGTAIVIVRSHADAADVVQDAMLSAWQSLGSLRDPIAFPAWFRTHVVRAALRAARRRSPVISIDVVSEASRSADVDAVVEQRMLGRVFDTATLDDRVLLTLRYLWGTPVSEVAAVLGVPEGTVKSRTHAAMARLRAAYDAEARR